MTFREKLRYHHTHPAKLIVDASAVIAAAVLLWQQHLLRAIAVGIVLPAIASACVILFADLEKQRDSRFGRYVARSMTWSMEAALGFGVLLFWGGAWYRSIRYCLVGLLVITLAWRRDTLFKTRSPR
jgi:Na+-translocating ferredoxin:NAD+ oxidoreductase RnfA subunit